MRAGKSGERASESQRNFTGWVWERSPAGIAMGLAGLRMRWLWGLLADYYPLSLHMPGF